MFLRQSEVSQGRAFLLQQYLSIAFPPGAALVSRKDIEAEGMAGQVQGDHCMPGV